MHCTASEILLSFHLALLPKPAHQEAAPVNKGCELFPTPLVFCELSFLCFTSHLKNWNDSWVKEDINMANNMLIKMQIV